MFLFGLFAFYAHQGYIYLFKNTAKTVILWNVLQFNISIYFVVIYTWYLFLYIYLMQFKL